MSSQLPEIDQEKGPSLPALIEQKGVDGVLFLDDAPPYVVRELQKLEIPFVLVDNHRQYPEVYAVDNDDRGGIRKATIHLAQNGYAKIAFLGLRSNFPLGGEAWQGFREGMQEMGLSIDPGLLSEGKTPSKADIKRCAPYCNREGTLRQS